MNKNNTLTDFAFQTVNVEKKEDLDNPDAQAGHVWTEFLSFYLTSLVADLDLQIRGGGGVIQTLDPWTLPWIRHWSYSGIKHGQLQA